MMIFLLAKMKKRRVSLMEMETKLEGMLGRTMGLTEIITFCYLETYEQLFAGKVESGKRVL